MSDLEQDAPYDARLDLVLSLAVKKGADGILISNLPDIRWACGFSGSNGLLLVLQGSRTLITDGRYTHQAGMEVVGADVLIAANDVLDEMERFSVNRLAIQSDHVTGDVRSRLEKVLLKTELRPVTHFLEHLRAEKNAEEIASIREALRISERVLEKITSLIRQGITERELAAEIDYRQRIAGAESTAFQTIVAFGENSALPHARPTERTLTHHENILVDTGCVINGFSSDITRNYFIGPPPDEYINVYEAVESARESAVNYGRTGIRADELDAAARSSIETAGYGQYFTHSLGHGVGLEVHEYPRISQSSNATLPNQAVVTIEPGIYLPEKFGVRIEDLILLEEGGATRLNTMSTELKII